MFLKLLDTERIIARIFNDVVYEDQNLTGYVILRSSGGTRGSIRMG